MLREKQDRTGPAVRVTEIAITQQDAERAVELDPGRRVREPRDAFCGRLDKMPLDLSTAFLQDSMLLRKET